MDVQGPQTRHPSVPRWVLWGILVIVILIIAVGGYYILKNDEINTNSINTAAGEDTNTAANIDINTNVETNTNQEQDLVSSYAAPEGPFTTNASTTVAFSYSKSNDRLVSRITKVNATTGQTIMTAQFNALDIQKTLQLPQTPSRPTSFRFGADGDSVIFLLSGSSPSPFIGMYRSSFSTPEKIETVVQYDPDNLFNGDIPSIADFSFDAQTNQVVFVIRGDATEERNHYVKVVNLQDKAVRDLGAYPTTPQLVGFPKQGEDVEVLYADKVQDKGGKNQDVMWYYDIIRLADAEVISTKKLVDEAKINQTTGDPYVNLTPDSIAPNNQVAGFRHSRKNNGVYESIFAFYNLTTGPLPEIVIPSGSGHNFVWEPSSGKILYSRYENGSKGIILDLAKGEVDTIADFGTPLLWYPSTMIIYTTSANILASYNPTTKKRVDISTEVPFYGENDYGMGGNSAFSKIRWVNR